MITKTKAVVMFFLLLIGSMGAVCQELGGGAREEVEKLAIQYYEEGKLQESYDLLASLAKENNGDAVVFLYLGRIAFQGGNMDAAEKCFRKAIEADPKFAPPHSDLSAMLLSQKKYADAEKSAMTAVKLDPKFALGFANLGMTQLAQKKKSDARANFLKAAKLDASAITNCGVDMMLKQKDPETANYFFDISLEAVPDQPLVLFNSGQAYKLLGNDRKALEMFKRAYDLSEVNRKPFGLAYYGYFRQLLDVGDYDTIFKQGLSRVGVDYPDGQLIRALAYYKMGRKAEFEKTARKYFELSGEKMPDSLDQWAKDASRSPSK